MPPKSTENLQKHTLNLRRGDYAELQRAYPDRGAGPIIREIIARYVDDLGADNGR